MKNIVHRKIRCLECNGVGRNSDIFANLKGGSDVRLETGDLMVCDRCGAVNEIDPSSPTGTRRADLSKLSSEEREALERARVEAAKGRGRGVA